MIAKRSGPNHDRFNLMRLTQLVRKIRMRGGSTFRKRLLLAGTSHAYDVAVRGACSAVRG